MTKIFISLLLVSLAAFYSQDLYDSYIAKEIKLKGSSLTSLICALIENVIDKNNFVMSILNK